MDIEKLQALGTGLGYEGEELREFIRDQQALMRDERNAERDERNAERQRQKEEREHQLALESARLDKERAEFEKDREIERARLERDKEIEQARLEKDRERERFDKEIRMLTLEHAHELETLQIKGKDAGIQSTSIISKAPKLSPFNESHDQMDAYLNRFERYATTMKWDKAAWALHLSALLKGNALNVYSLLPEEKANDFSELKSALLKRFDMTEEGFKNRFRNGKPEPGETFSQFMVRLSGYLNRWIEMSGVDKSFEGLCDLIAREQFIKVCNHDLALFLKERIPEDAEQMAKLADQFKEARGVSASVLSKNSSQKNQGPPTFQSKVSKREASPTTSGNKGNSSFQGKSDRRCYKCGKLGHIASDCRPHRVASMTQETENSPTKKSSGGWFKNRKRSPSPRDKKVRFKEDDHTDTKVCNACTLSRPDTLDTITSNTLPIMSNSCQPNIMSVMPVRRGKVGDSDVSVLRDTGCSGVVIRHKLVPETCKTGKKQTCLLADGTKSTVPLAYVHIDTPYYTGEVEAWCMETPLYDVIVGNIPGAREPNDPDPSWEVSAVQTRNQRKQQQKPYPSLKVPEVMSQVVSIEEIREAQLADESLSKIRQLAEKGEVRQGKKEAKIAFVKRNGLYFRQFESPRVDKGKKFTQLVVPKKHRPIVLKLAHESLMAGHMSTQRSVHRVLSEFYWPGVQADTKRFCRSCDICQRTLPKGRVGKVPLGKMPLIEIPFKRVAVDLIGPLQPATDRGNRYILTLVDYATRFPEAIALPGIETERVAEALLDIFCRVGFPQEMITDMGAQFTSALMAEVSRLISLKQLTTTPYHPMCNGLVERFNGTLKQMLKRMCANNPKDWDKYLNAMLFAYREVPQESLGFSPFDLVYGWSVRGPMTILKELWSKEFEDPEVKTTYQYVVDLRDKLETVSEMAHDNLRQAANKQKLHFDKKAKHRDIQVGDKVLVLLPKKANKLLLQWRGPFVVEEKMGHYDFRIRVRGKIKTYHANLLKKYTEREETVSSMLGQVGVAMIDEMYDEVDDQDHEIVEPPVPRGTQSYVDVTVSDLLDQNQQREVRELLAEFSDVLTDQPGCTNLIEHDIKLTTDTPIRQRPYPLPFSKLSVVEKEINDMLKLNVIEPSDSPYSSPIVLIAKKDNTTRFCIDMRALNRITIFDAEPIPNMEEIFAKLSGYSYFSKFDLSKGYWQVPLSENAKAKTAFQTPQGLFQFRMMPFGVVNAPATFSRLMRKLLHELKNLDNFIDDIIVFTKTWLGHLQVLRELFTRLRNAKLTAKPSKCSIGYDHIECLGHLVGKNRLFPHPNKVKAIEDAARPETKHQIKSFLGLVGFYQKFIPNFSHVAAPLTDLTKKGLPNKIQWTENQENSFRALKQALTSEPILKLPDLSQPFSVQTDASDFGIGGILLQDEGGIKRPIMYASRKLKQSERNYSVIEKECLAIVWAIQKFSRYLYGTEFLLETDHKPLMYLNKARVANARLMRWALMLQPYRYRIMAIKGSENVGADYLSRQ